MGIDASIISGIRPVQLQQQDPLDSYAKSLTLQNLMQKGDLEGLQVQQARQGINDENAVRSAYQQSGGDSARLRALLGQGGQYKQIQALDKLKLAQDEKQSSINKNTAAAAKDTHEVRIKNLEHGAALFSEAKDQASYDSVKRIGAMTGVFKPEEIAQMPAEFNPQFVSQLSSSALTMAKKLEDQRKQQELAQTVVRDTNTNARGVEANRIAAGVAGETARHHGVEEKNAAGQASRDKLQIVTDTDGNITVVDKNTGVGKPAVGADGNVLKGRQNMTESQGKAAGMLHRADAANNILNGLEEQGAMNRGIIKQGVEKVPLVGEGLAMGVNMLPSSMGGPSPKQQQVEQARRDFVNAALRVESGAAISNSEFQNAEKQYFPMPGDSKEVLAQKRKNRETELEALRLQAGPTKTAQTIRLAASIAPAGDVRSQADAILGKSNGQR